MNYGCKYLDNLELWNNAYFENQMLIELQKVFLFDIFIGNIDRSNIKPNLFLKDDKIYILDHEIAFSYTLTIAHSLNFCENDLTNYKELHLLYPILRGSELQCNNFIEKLTLLNEDYWKDMNSLIPDEWRNIDEVVEMFSKIEKYSISIVSNLNNFVNTINKFLKLPQ